MAAIANDTRGSDISVLHVAPLIYWTRYMVSSQQLQLQRLVTDKRPTDKRPACNITITLRSGLHAHRRCCWRAVNSTSRRHDLTNDRHFHPH